MSDRSFDRRKFLFAGVAVSSVAAAKAIHDGELGAPPETITGGMPWTEGAADSPPAVAGGNAYLYFTAAEGAFVEAAVDRLIPADPVGPGAVEAGVPTFIDRQLAGPYGRGDHFFLGGPWPVGTPEQGYQSRYSPAQLYRAAVPAIDTYVAAKTKAQTFVGLAAADRDAVLKAIESGDAQLGNGVSAKLFFAMLLQNTKEGYFSDPVYGGNRDMAAWKMIGFPGARYDYREWVGRHGVPFPNPPVGFKGRSGWRAA
jgi:gluconate 2-dehydrogenase gamma chain